VPTKRKPIQPVSRKVSLDIPLQKIISGGQTGVDRAALDFAISNGIPHGGWCPQGRAAEDGELAELYSLDETPGADYAQRTEWNVRDSDGTVIFSIAPKLFGGSEFTAEVAKRLNKPCLHISKSVVPHTGAKRLKDFVLRNHIRVLNVAGPRASNEPNVAQFVHETLKKLFRLAKSSDR
jgi:hypothetical protein